MSELSAAEYQAILRSDLDRQFIEYLFFIELHCHVAHLDHV